MLVYHTFCAKIYSKKGKKKLVVGIKSGQTSKEEFPKMKSQTRDRFHLQAVTSVASVAKCHQQL